VGRDEGGRRGASPARDRQPVRKKSSAGLVLGLVLGGGCLALVLGGCTGLIVYLAVFRDRTIPDAEWLTFTPPGGGFTVSLPGTPATRSQVLNGLPVTKYEVKRPKDDKLFLVACIDLDARLIRPNILDEMAKGERDNMVRASNSTVTREEPVFLGGIEGREFELRAPDGSVGISRIFLAKAGGRYRTFQLAVAGKSIRPGRGDAARFLDSFQLDASASPPNVPGGPVAQGPQPFRPTAANPPAPKGNPKSRPKKQRDRSAPPGERPVWHEVGGEQTISLAFSPDGATLAVGHWNKRLRLWDVAGSTDRQVFPLDYAPTALAYSKDGARLALGGNGRVFLWDAAARKEVRRFQVLHTRHKDQIEVVALTFTPDGKALAVGVGPGGNSDGEVRLWDLEANRERIVSPNCGEKMKRLAFAPGGALVVLMPFSVKVCDAATLQFRREFKAPRWEEQFVTSALSPDGQTLATFGADRKLKLWRLSDGVCEKTWQMKADVHQSSYFPMEYSPDGKLLVLGCLGPNLYVWDAQAGKELKVRRLGQSAGNVDLLTFSPDGRLLAGHSSNGPAILEVDKLLAGN
jgi:WD40 repeat protein